MNENYEAKMVEEKQGMTTGQKLLVAGGIVASAIIGYKFGKAYEGFLFNTGLDKLCEIDPTLENHMWEAIGKAKVVMGKN